MMVVPDTIYYEPKSNQLNQNGQTHLHLLLAKEVQLKKIGYSWDGMPVLEEKSRRAIHVRRDAGNETEVVVRQKVV